MVFWVNIGTEAADRFARQIEQPPHLVVGQPGDGAARIGLRDQPVG